MHNIAVGIQEMHGVQIAHQDINPSNVLLLIRQFIGEEFEKNSGMLLTVQDSIAQIKQSLNQFSSNPLLWVELARNYLTLGLAGKASVHS